MDKKKRLLVVDDEESIRFTFEAFLTDAGYPVDTAESLIEAATLFADHNYDVIFLDILLGRDSGMQLLRVVHEQNPSCQVVMITGSPEIATAAESVRLGAFDYLVKPLQKDDLLRIAKLAVDRKEMIDLQETFRLRMAAVFGSIQEGVLVFDETYRLVDMNTSALEMTGCPTEIIGQPLHELTDHCDCQMIRSFQEIVGQRCLGEIYLLKMTNCQGRELTVSLTMSPLTSPAGRETGVVLVLRDEGLPSRTVVADTV